MLDPTYLTFLGLNLIYLSKLQPYHILTIVWNAYADCAINAENTQTLTEADNWWHHIRENFPRQVAVK